MLQSYSASLQFQFFLVESTLQINCLMLFPTVFWRNWLLMARTGVWFTGKELSEWPSSSSSRECNSIQPVFSNLKHFPGLSTGSSLYCCMWRAAGKLSSRKEPQGADLQSAEHNQQSNQVAKKTNSLFTCIWNSVASHQRCDHPLVHSTSENVPETLCSVLGPHCLKATELINHVQRWTLQLVKGLENKTYEEQLGELGLFSTEKRGAEKRPHCSSQLPKRRLHGGRCQSLFSGEKWKNGTEWSQAAPG